MRENPTPTHAAPVPWGPPKGPPWDLPVAEAPLCFVDLEMTGLDVTADRVVEICIQRWVGDSQVDALSTLVLPPERVGGAAHVHGLDAAALAGAPSFPEVAPAVQRILSGGVFIAHGAGWDVRFLHAELHRMGIAPMVQFYIDTLHLSRRSFALPKYSLGALAEHFQWDRGTAHRAESDVRVLRELFRRCTESLSPVSVRDLWEVRAGQRQARAAVVEGCQRALASQEPLLLTYRPSRKPPEDMLFMVQGVRTDLDPPVVMGYQLPGRSRKELRADRILRVDPPSLEEDS